VVVSNGCGASASFVTPPQFDLTTGIGLAYGKSSVTGCGPPGFSDFGSTQGTTGFDSSVFVLKSPTPTQLWFNLSVSFAYNLSATPQNVGGGPYAWASFTLNVIATSFDVTTLSAGIGCLNLIGYATTNGSATGNVSGGYHGPAGCGFTGPLPFTAGDKYIVQIYVEVWEFTYAPSATSTHASAQANMGTGTHELKVHSWTIH